jgi:hypothetical protein
MPDKDLEQGSSRIACPLLATELWQGPAGLKNKVKKKMMM